MGLKLIFLFVFQNALIFFLNLFAKGEIECVKIFFQKRTKKIITNIIHILTRMTIMHSAKLLFQNPWGYNLWLCSQKSSTLFLHQLSLPPKKLQLNNGDQKKTCKRVRSLETVVTVPTLIRLEQYAKFFNCNNRSWHLFLFFD